MSEHKLVTCIHKEWGVAHRILTVGTLPNGYTRASPLPRIPSSKSRVPFGRQLPGLHRAASMA
eukprot:scaffold33271_cov50-Cyclotella_meneghiniana.AAC.2